jgi:hypothetical protein
LVLAGTVTSMVMSGTAQVAMSLVLDWLDAEASTGRIESVARMTVRRAVSFFFMGFSFQGLAAG